MNLFNNISFEDPWYLLLLLLLPVLAWWLLKRQETELVEMKMSSLDAVSGIKSWKSTLRRFLPLLKIAAIGLLMIAMARPQNVESDEKVKAEGIDIVLSLDISGSMLAQDFKPDRLGAAKNTAKEFVDGREHDRVGLVVFAGESFTQCPLTSDHNVLKVMVDQLQSGIIEDGTAIGEGLAIAVNRLRESESDSKVIILLTDGVSNKGSIDPLTAAEMAKEYDIKVYTIGVGTTGTAPFPQRDFFGRTILRQVNVEIDEALLKDIAKQTNGRYFRATNNEALRNIYEEINKLEKTEVEVTTFKKYTERFYGFATMAVILLLLQFVLSSTVLRSIP